MIRSYFTIRMGMGIFAVTILLFSSSLLSTAGGNELSDTCTANCVKLLSEAFKVDNNEPCHDRTRELYEENNSCRENCQNVILSSTTDTGWSAAENFVPATSSPLFHNSGFDFISLKWNTSEEVSKSVAFYILQIQPNIQSLKRPLELLPSIPRYIMVNGTDNKLQRYTVKNLANGFHYRFRVAAVGFNRTSGEYSPWSRWYSTSDDCDQTTGVIERAKFPFGKEVIKVNFSCPVSRITLNVSIKAVDRRPVVLDARLNWKNPARIHPSKDITVQVTVKLLKHKDESIGAMCEHYHDTDFVEYFSIYKNETSLDLLSKISHGTSGSNPKKSIHFGCSYEVKFEVLGAIKPNSFESTTTFKIPECLLNVSSCPVPETRPTSDAINEKIYLEGNNGSTYAANISWNAEEWFKSHKIEFFHVEVQERSTGYYYYAVDVPAEDGIFSYHAVAHNMREGKRYLIEVRAFHGLNCIHDIGKQKFIQIKKPCPLGCTENATCFPVDVFDGTASCKCKDGYSGNGTICTAIIIAPSMPVSGDGERNVNVLAIILPLAFVIALVALIFAFIHWRIKKRKQLILNAIEAHELPISPSSSNSNLYQHCPPRYNAAETSSKENEVEMDEKEVNVIYVPQEIQDAISGGLTDGYEFNADLIKFEECLGKGAFGYVHRARALGITAEPEWTQVAVKTLSEPVTEKSVEDFIAEIELMKRIGDHENIIRMLGCCTLTLPICLIMEYAPHGNLLAYLKAAKTKLLENGSAKKSATIQKLDGSFDKEDPANEKQSIAETLSSEENEFPDAEASKYHDHNLLENNTFLESFAFQIAKGMAYVAGQGIVHRDLAARNVLIGKDYQLKISDFGLSKEGVYVKSTSGKIPLRWLSIEAIRERIYSSASDVWSYGIVLWEICTLGDFPYPTVSDRELLKFLISGERLEKPSNCSDEMYAMMLQCWQSEPEDRPTFAHLRNTLWKMNTGESPYVNIDPMPENHATSSDIGDSIENSLIV